MAKCILFSQRHFPSLTMAYKLGKPRGKMFICLSLPAKRSNMVRNWTEVDFQRAKFNSEKPNKSQGECPQDPSALLWVLSPRSWFTLRRTCLLFKASLMSRSAIALVLSSDCFSVSSRVCHPLPTVLGQAS